MCPSLLGQASFCPGREELELSRRNGRALPRRSSPAPHSRRAFWLGLSRSALSSPLPTSVPSGVRAARPQTHEAQVLQPSRDADPRHLPPPGEGARRVARAVGRRRHAVTSPCVDAAARGPWAHAALIPRRRRGGHRESPSGQEADPRDGARAAPPDTQAPLTSPRPRRPAPADVCCPRPPQMPMPESIKAVEDVIRAYHGRLPLAVASSGVRPNVTRVRRRCRRRGASPRPPPPPPSTLRAHGAPRPRPRGVIIHPPCALAPANERSTSSTAASCTSLTRL